MATVLDRIFDTERLRKRAAPSGGFAVPIMQERAVTHNVEPVLVTNTRGEWIQSRMSSNNDVRCGLFPCSPMDETVVFHRLLATIQAGGWCKRCSSVSEALKQIPGAGEHPTAIVISQEDLKGIGLEEDQAEKLMQYQGFISRQGNLTTLVGPLPSGQSLVVAHDVGLYIRVDEYLGLMLFRADTNLILVQR